MRSRRKDGIEKRMEEEGRNEIGKNEYKKRRKLKKRMRIETMNKKL